MAKMFSREDAVVLFTEMLTAAISEGKTCVGLDERRLREAMRIRLEAAAAYAELQALKDEVPIPPWVSIKFPPTGKLESFATPIQTRLGPNGGWLPIGGGFELTRIGSASVQQLPKATVDSWIAGADPFFSDAVRDGVILVEPVDERTARGLELHARAFAAVGRQAARINAVAIPSTKFGVFHGGGSF